MKKIFLILLIMYSFSICSYSQIVWAPESAKWTYNGQGQITSYIEIEYVRDTLLLGKQSKVLKKTQFTYRSQTNDVDSSFLGNEITYEDDSVVYFYTYNKFDTLFSFNSLIGDSWKLNCHPNSGICQKNGKVTVKDTGTIVINNLPLRYLAVTYNYDTIIGDEPYIVEDTIIERIGSTSLYFLPWDIVNSMLDGNEGSKLRCYSDNKLEVYTNNYGKPCAYLASIKYSNYEDFSLYPNPCSNFLFIKNINGSNISIEIRNIFGSLIITNEISTKSQPIDISAIPKGVYFITVTTSRVKLFRKIIKI